MASIDLGKTIAKSKDLCHSNQQNEYLSVNFNKGILIIATLIWISVINVIFVIIINLQELITIVNLITLITLIIN